MIIYLENYCLFGTYQVNIFISKPKTPIIKQLYGVCLTKKKHSETLADYNRKCPYVYPLFTVEMIILANLNSQFKLECRLAKRICEQSLKTECHGYLRYLRRSLCNTSYRSFKIHL